MHLATLVTFRMPSLPTKNLKLSLKNKKILRLFHKISKRNSKQILKKISKTQSHNRLNKSKAEMPTQIY